MNAEIHEGSAESSLPNLDDIKNPEDLCARLRESMGPEGDELANQIEDIMENDKVRDSDPLKFKGNRFTKETENLIENLRPDLQEIVSRFLEERKGFDVPAKDVYDVTPKKGTPHFEEAKPEEKLEKFDGTINDVEDFEGVKRILLVNMEGDKKAQENWERIDRLINSSLKQRGALLSVEEIEDYPEGLHAKLEELFA